MAAFLVDHGGVPAFRAQVTDHQPGVGGVLFRGAVPAVALAVPIAFLGLLAFGILEVLIQRMGDAIRQAAYAVGAKAHRAPAADAGQLAEDLLQAPAWLDGRGQS